MSELTDRYGDDAENGGEVVEPEGSKTKTRAETDRTRSPGFEGKDSKGWEEKDGPVLEGSLSW